MTQRTANIIGICKGLSSKYNSLLIKQNVFDYLSSEVDSVHNHYDDESVDAIILNSLLDFVDSLEKPSRFLRTILFNDDKSTSFTTKVLVAFSNVEIKRHGVLVNGFTLDLVKQMHIDLEV